MRNDHGLRATTLAVAGASSAASAALGVAAVVIARALGPDGRGVFAADYSLLFVLIIVGSLGIGPGGRRLLAIGPPDGVTFREFNAAMNRLLVGQAILASISAAVLLPIFGAGRSLGEQVAFVCCCVCTLALLLSREALFGLGGGAAAEAIVALISIATLCSVAGLALTDRLNVPGVLWVYSAAAATGYGAMSTIAFRRAGRAGRAGRTVRADSTERLVASGRPILVLLIAQAVATRGDRLVIGAIEGSSELGQYAVAVSVMELLSVGAIALANVSFQGLANGTLPAQTIARARRGTMVVTLAAAAILIVAAPWLIKVAFGSRFEDAVAPLRVLAIAAVPYGLYQIDTQHLIARGHARSAASLTSWAAALMVVGDLLIVPRWGILGAAWLSVGVFSGAAAMTRRAARRCDLSSDT